MDTVEDEIAGPSRKLEAVMIFDGECPFCSAAATALRRLDTVGVVPWEDEAAQSFLDAQFGEVPFLLALVDPAEDTIYLGRTAARELCERAGLPEIVGSLVRDNYETVADAVQRTATSEATLDRYHGTVSISEPATDHLESLFGQATGAIPGEQ